MELNIFLFKPSKMKIGRTFCFNSKSSLLKLLCTLARLCEVTPLQPLRLNFFGINFPLHPRSQLPFLTFRGQDNRGEIAQIPCARSAPQPSHPRDIETHPISHLFTSKVISTLRCAIPHLRTPLEEYFPCVSRNNFSMHSPWALKG